MTRLAASHGRTKTNLIIIVRLEVQKKIVMICFLLMLEFVVGILKKEQVKSAPSDAPKTSPDASG